MPNLLNSASILLSLNCRRRSGDVPLHFIFFFLQFLGKEDFFNWNLPFLLRSFGVSFHLCQKLGFGKTTHRFITHMVISDFFNSLRLPMQYLCVSAKMCRLSPSRDMQLLAFNYLRQKYFLSNDIWIVLQLCWIGLKVPSYGFTEKYNSLNGFLRKWLRPDNPLIHGMKMIIWLESGFANSVPSPSNISQIICRRKQDRKPCSFFHDICEGMIHLSFRQEEEANECFKVARRLLMLENPIHVELYLVYLNNMIAKYNDRLVELLN